MIVPDQWMIDEVVDRWKASQSGCPLRQVPFEDARQNECHANAAAYVALYGGDVVHGFLLQPHGSWSVYVIAHSVARLASGDLVDPTLTDDQRRG